MHEPGCRENYPLRVVLVANLVLLLIYGIGAWILAQVSLALGIGYVIFILVLEFRLISGHCVDCYYFGKTCAFGKGRLSALLFPKGDPEKFVQIRITWKEILPDFLVFIIPALAGVLLLVREFSFVILLLIFILLILGFAGNALVRGQLACRYCRQKEIGCPAAQLFDKTERA